jgi:hypothetical protein
VSEPLRTRWRLVGLVDVAGVQRRSLDVELVVDTTAPLVVSAIERAASRAGIRLERVLADDVKEPAPNQATSPETATGSQTKGTRA